MAMDGCPTIAVSACCSHEVANSIASRVGNRPFVPRVVVICAPWKRQDGPAHASGAGAVTCVLYVLAAPWSSGGGSWRGPLGMSRTWRGQTSRQMSSPLVLSRAASGGDPDRARGCTECTRHCAPD